MKKNKNLLTILICASLLIAIVFTLYLFAHKEDTTSVVPSLNVENDEDNKIEEEMSDEEKESLALLSDEEVEANKKVEEEVSRLNKELEEKLNSRGELTFKVGTLSLTLGKTKEEELSETTYDKESVSLTFDDSKILTRAKINLVDNTISFNEKELVKKGDIESVFGMSQMEDKPISQMIIFVNGDDDKGRVKISVEIDRETEEILSIELDTNIEVDIKEN